MVWHQVVWCHMFSFSLFYFLLSIASVILCLLYSHVNCGFFTPSNVIHSFVYQYLWFLKCSSCFSFFLSFSTLKAGTRSPSSFSSTNTLVVFKFMLLFYFTECVCIFFWIPYLTKWVTFSNFLNDIVGLNSKDSFTHSLSEHVQVRFYLSTASELMNGFQSVHFVQISVCSEYY